MTLPVFKLEEYLGEWEFKARYLLCCSDAQTWSMREILALADRESERLWNEISLGYTEVPGLPVLRQEIARLYEGLTADNILCLAGAEEGILCAARAMLAKGDHAIVVTPCYQSLEELPRDTGADITAIPLREEDEWELDVDKVKQSIRSNTKMLWFNYPHNPTGKRLSKAKLNELVALAREHGVIIFSDEVYRLLGEKHGDVEPSIASIYERGISLGVMSKSFGMAGLRIGWFASPDKELLKKIEYVKHYTSICNSAPAEVLSLIALRAKEQILQRNNQIVRENISLLDQFFQRQSSLFSWVRPTGGCVGFPRYLGADSIDNFCKELVHETNVLLMPGSVYSFAGNNFRIGFGRKNMPEALAKLEEFLLPGNAVRRCGGDAMHRPSIVET